LFGDELRLVFEKNPLDAERFSPCSDLEAADRLPALLLLRGVSGESWFLPRERGLLFLENRFPVASFLPSPVFRAGVEREEREDDDFPDLEDEPEVLRLRIGIRFF
jgi:hypothetical protein